MKKRKIFALALSAIIFLSLLACNSEDVNDYNLEHDNSNDCYENDKTSDYNNDYPNDEYDCNDSNGSDYDENDSNQNDTEIVDEIVDEVITEAPPQEEASAVENPPPPQTEQQPSTPIQQSPLPPQNNNVANNPPVDPPATQQLPPPTTYRCSCGTNVGTSPQNCPPQLNQHGHVVGCTCTTCVPPVVVPPPPTEYRCACGTNVGTVPQSCPPPPASNANPSMEAEILRLVNVERANHGLPALIHHAGLASAARGHSEDMVTRNFLAHNCPSGGTPLDRILDVGLGGGTENISALTRAATAQIIVNNWMNSASGHRDVILIEQNVRFIGVGVYSNRVTLKVAF